MLNINTVFVIGSGAMGAGIAQMAAVAGFRVFLSDLTQERVNKAQALINSNLDKMAAKGKLTEEPDVIRKRLTYTDSYEMVTEADMVIEAIYENLEAKKEIFKSLAPLVRDDTVLASNTSSISLTALASVIPHPERFIGLHFFYPVPVMKLLEIVVSLHTSPETVAIGAEFGRQMGKETVVAKDSPGFIVNRALVVMLNEAIFLYEEGVGSAEDIDKALMLGCNHPIGPLSLADMLGLDIVCAVMETFYTGFADSKYRPSPLLRKMVVAGMLGTKTRQGFYKYDESGKKIIS